MRHALGLAVAVISIVLAGCSRDSAHPHGRTLSVVATETVTAEPDLATLHIGFDTQPEDMKSAYADGARRSNAIIAALRQSGISENAIRSECQYLERNWSKEHRFTFAQQWTVKVAPIRAAEILDVAISNGANSSGQIEWTVKDAKALENDALDRASARVRENAAVLAKGMGAQLGTLISTSNQASPPHGPIEMYAMQQAPALAKAAPRIALEPHLVSQSATVSAVFAIE